MSDGLSSEFHGSASLIDFVDERVLVVLQDGRHLIGTLRTYDQFSNMVLEHTLERHVAGGKYCDIPLGIYMVKGDTVVLTAELDEEKEAALPWAEGDIEEVMTAEADEEDALLDAGQPLPRHAWNMGGVQG